MKDEIEPERRHEDEERRGDQQPFRPPAMARLAMGSGLPPRIAATMLRRLTSADDTTTVAKVISQPRVKLTTKVRAVTCGLIQPRSLPKANLDPPTITRKPNATPSATPTMPATSA